jgi:hypothetical protein
VDPFWTILSKLSCVVRLGPPKPPKTTFFELVSNEHQGPGCFFPGCYVRSVDRISHTFSAYSNFDLDFDLDY